MSGKIAGVDSGDTHAFDPSLSCIIGVRPGVVVLGESSICHEAGEPGPFSFHVLLGENDFFTFPSGFCLTPAVGPDGHAGPECSVDDDLIGWAELFFPIWDLEASLPNVGDSVTETVALFPCPEAEICGAWDFADYTFTYRTTRLADRVTDFRSELTAAMTRSGIAVAGDAVAAGLRSLATPMDRNAEIEPRAAEGRGASGAVAADLGERPSAD